MNKKKLTLHKSFKITMLVLACLTIITILAIFYLFPDNYKPTITAIIMDDHGIPWPEDSPQNPHNQKQEQKSQILKVQ